MSIAALLLAAVVPMTEVLEGLHDYQDVELECNVADVFADPLGGEPLNHFLILEQDGKSLYLPVNTDIMPAEQAYALLGARIHIFGIPCISSRQPNRRYSGRVLLCREKPDIRVISPGPADRFAVPRLPLLDAFSPIDFPTLGRRRVDGRVLAVWGGDNLLIATASNDVMRVSLVRAEPPTCGDVVEVAGVPETDTYRLSMSRAVWRPSSADVPAAAEPVDTPARELDIRHYGRTVRLKGRLTNQPEVGKLLGIDSDGRLLSVDTGALTPVLETLEKGAEVEVTGVGVFLIAPWRQTAPFPKIEGFTIVPRSPRDVRILAAPPWWTPARFMLVLGVLLSLLLAVVVWNRVLQVVANRRGHELMRERLGSERARLKVGERTRLAVELHDTLSQTLAGVAMQIETAQQFPEGASPELLKHLDIADRALDSCRSELRNCLWDLRSETLDEKDLSEAIRKTLLPHSAHVELVIRFNVSRRLLSDNTVHSLLQMIRELALNGIRHGGATCVKIAGAYKDGMLLFSVSDNGCGFDEASRPGLAQGHFGLEGVKTRVGAMGGSFAIESAPGKGTKATISISAACMKDEEEVE